MLTFIIVYEEQLIAFRRVRILERAALRKLLVLPVERHDVPNDVPDDLVASNFNPQALWTVKEVDRTLQVIPI